MRAMTMPDAESRPQNSRFLATAQNSRISLPHIFRWHRMGKCAYKEGVGANNAFERPVMRRTSARGQRAPHFAPSARLKAPRPAAQRER
jgi:hypothetical protein